MPWPIRFGPEPRMMTAGRSRGRDLGLLVVGRVVVRRASRRTRRRRCRRSCRPAGCRARGAARGRRPRSAPRSSPICASEKPCRLAAPQRRRRRDRRRAGDLAATSSMQHQLVEEPRVDAGGLVQLLDGRAGPHRLLHRDDPAVGRAAWRRSSSSALSPGSPCQWKRGAGLLQRAQRLLQRLGEVAADRHRLADALHVVVSVGRRRGTSRRRTAGTLTTT